MFNSFIFSDKYHLKFQNPIDTAVEQSKIYDDNENRITAETSPSVVLGIDN